MARERQTDRAGASWPEEATTLAPALGLVACYYCGLLADTKDHVRPQSLGDRAAFFASSALPPDITVPACRECNCALGARFFRTLGDRKAWIKGRLRRRYRKLLQMPHWTDAELGRLSGMLRVHVEQLQIAAATAWARVRW